MTISITNRDLDLDLDVDPDLDADHEVDVGHDLDHDRGPDAFVDDALAVGEARCADGNGTLTPLFFSDHIVDIGRAKAICAKCVLRERCLDDALQREEPWGVWGGELLSGGRIVAVKRPCGRPPKHPRPELVIDEMGVVEVA